jgi:mono/diheme cytochrome c family protein
MMRIVMHNQLLLGTRWCLLPLLALSLVRSVPAAGGPASAAAQVVATNGPVLSLSTETPTTSLTTNQADLTAARFATTCAGCHSLTGARLSGPELTPATSWPLDQLKTAIKRMEKNVGPIMDDQVEALAQLLKSPDVRGRIKAAQERIQAQFMAKMAPPDPVIGRQLFFGTAPLRNGGLPCSACHAAAGTGGSLGPDLTGVFTRLGGQTPLVSAIEKASFKIMAPHYSRHPVTTQEAMHLANYLSTLDLKAAGPTQAAFMPIGAGAGLALLIGLTFHLRQQRVARGRDLRLQRRRK